MDFHDVLSVTQTLQCPLGGATLECEHVCEYDFYLIFERLQRERTDEQIWLYTITQHQILKNIDLIISTNLCLYKVISQ